MPERAYPVLFNANFTLMDASYPSPVMGAKHRIYAYFCDRAI